MSHYQEQVDQLEHIVDALHKAHNNYATEYAAFATAQDVKNREIVMNAVVQVRKLQPTMFVLVGIGGSNMGTLAVLQTLYGMNYQDCRLLKFLCADTIDAEYNKLLLEKVEQEYRTGGRVLLCIITKSGTTTETVINAALFLDLIKKHRPNDYKQFVVAITDEDSALAQIAQQEQFLMLAIPKLVGGRYSIFSAVGLFPLALMGIDIEQFCKGAEEALDEAIGRDFEKREYADHALTAYEHYQRGYRIHDIFVFSPALVYLAQWYKQLIGESLGKQYDIDGNVVEVGITPTVSVGTVDLHSVVQLYLAGPRITTTSFLYFADEPENPFIPDNILSGIIPGLAGRSVSFVKKSIIEGVLAAYTDEVRPFTSTPLKKTSYTIGNWMMGRMIETVFLAKLLHINPFDQPAVELYKKRARAFMGG